MPETTDRTDVIINNLEAGKLAKPKMYNTLLKRVNGGEILSKKDLETFETLDKELRDTYLPGQIEAPGTACSDPAAKPGIGPFKNVPDVQRYLEDQGWKIKYRAIYNHVKARKLIAEADGTFTRAEVDRYALANLKKADGTVPQPRLTEADKIAIEAAEYRRDRERAQARILDTKARTLEGELVPRSAFESELAGRAAVFRSDLDNFFHSQLPAIVHIVSGDAAKIPEVMAFCMDEVENMLSRYLQKQEIKVDASAYQKLFEQVAKEEREEDEGDTPEGRA